MLNGFANNTDKKHGGFFPLFSWLKESAKPALLSPFPSSILFRPPPFFDEAFFFAEVQAAMRTGNAGHPFHALV